MKQPRKLTESIRTIILRQHTIDRKSGRIQGKVGMLPGWGGTCAREGGFGVDQTWCFFLRFSLFFFPPNIQALHTCGEYLEHMQTMSMFGFLTDVSNRC